MTGYLNGIEVVEQGIATATITTPSQNVIGLVGTAPHSELEADYPYVYRKEKEALEAVLPEALRDALTPDDDRGSLYHSLQLIYAQGGNVVVLIRASDDSTASIVRAIGKLANAQSVTGVKPKILCAPGHTGNIPVGLTEGDE